jgi:amino acid transporter
VFAVIYVTLGHTAGNGIAFARNFLLMVGIDNPTPGQIKGVGVAAITLACLLHGFWRAGGIWANNIISVIKVCILLVIIVTGFVAWGGGFDSVTENAFQSGKIFDKSTPYGYTESFISVVFSYSGFMNANYVRKPFVRRLQRRLTEPTGTERSPQTTEDAEEKGHSAPWDSLPRSIF